MIVDIFRIVLLFFSSDVNPSVWVVRMSQGQGKVSYGLLRWPFASLPSGSHLSVLGSRCQCICLHFPRLGKFRKIKGVPVFFPLFSLVSRENLHLDRSIPCIGGFSDQRTFMTCEKKSILYFTCKRVNKNENTSQDISNNSKYFNQISKNLSGKKRKHQFCPSQNKQNISTNLKTCPKVLFASRTVFS